MHMWMNSFRKQNPVVLCEILENQALFASSRVGFEKSGVEWSPSECYSGDLSVLGRCHYECDVEFAHNYTPEGLHCKLSHEPDSERRI